MGSQAEEVDWDRLDKSKMFWYGAGMFSGVTLALYPLSVIKTKQMTLPGISGGFQGVRQTASTIMRTEGMPGFYRGFGTVIFGTIPARGVYLTTLEWTKSETAKVVADVGLTGPAAAGIANFAGGALASLATQSVTVPIDVISQKQMVHGDETVVARHQHRRGVPPGLALSGRSNAVEAAAGAEASGASSSTGSGSGSGAASTSGSHSAGASSSGHPGGRTADPKPTAGPAAGIGPNAASSSAATSAAAQPSPSSSTPAADAAAMRNGGSGASGATSTSGRPPAQPQAAAYARRIGAMQMVRLILKEEGVAGLYRGFGASVATFVPSSAMWWGAYGAYQKLIWLVLDREEGGEDLGGGGSGGGEKQHMHSTGEVVTVQTTSSILAGCTSSLVTTPLDLVKTRIQVSYKHDGATPTFGEVARQILREDGAAGFLRGAVPRMINASLWGTCMVTVYEYLKRISAKDM